MSGTGSRETISACLPRCWSIMPQARTEPTASPSGRACAATRKRRPRSMASRTARISFGFCIGCGYISGFLAALALAAQQFVNAGLHLFRTVDVEGEVGNVADAHALMQLVADVSAGSHQPFQRIVFLLLAS